MCGIFGIVNPNGLTQAQLDYFTAALVRTEIRGHDSTGFYNDKMSVFKAAYPANKAVELSEYKEMLSSSIGCKWIVGHCRWATRGPPSIIENDHPVFVDQKDKVVVHNGQFNSPAFDKDPSKTDTFIPIWILEKDDLNGHENMLKGLEKLLDLSSGGNVIVIGTKTTLGFYRSHSRPLAFFTDSNKCVYFGSTAEIVGVDAKLVLDMGYSTAYSYDKEKNTWKYNKMYLKTPTVTGASPPQTALTEWFKNRAQAESTGGTVPIINGNTFEMRDVPRTSDPEIATSAFADHCKDYIPDKYTRNFGWCLEHRRHVTRADCTYCSGDEADPDLISSQEISPRAKEYINSCRIAKRVFLCPFCDKKVKGSHVKFVDHIRSCKGGKE